MALSSLASSSSSSAATVAVDKATSDLLISPDWTMNMDICDSVNSHNWQAKDVIKAVKKRLQHRSPRVQLLALTLLETMVKNCGDYVHFQIAERNILGEMVKIVKKKTDMQVRNKILTLVDSWQEAFGGPGGKHPQYYWVYEELRRSGVEFPKRSLDAAPIFTPPLSHPTSRHTQIGHGIPSSSSRRLDETMATEVEILSFASLDSMRNVMDLLTDMLKAVNPGDREALKDEVIVDLVNRSRSSQKKLMQMLTTTADEELLAQGLELNDSIQNLLAKHDAIASGFPLPSQVNTSSSQPKADCGDKLTEVKDSDSEPNGNPSRSDASVNRVQIDEDEEEEDEFAQLARRHTKTKPEPLHRTADGTREADVSLDTGYATTPVPGNSTASPCNALALPEPPEPVRTKAQDMIDFLSLSLSTSSASPETPSAPTQAVHQLPASFSTQGSSHAPVMIPGTQGHTPYSSYIVPWAQPHSQLLAQPHVEQQYPRNLSSNPPPPWAVTSGYSNSQNPFSLATGYSNNQNPLSTNSMFSTPRASAAVPYTSTQGSTPLQHNTSLHTRSTGSTILGSTDAGSASKHTPAGRKPFVPSYRLFEDLNVLGNGKFKMSGSSPSMSGSPGQGMVGGRK